MVQLGISAFYHDSAACIVVDGKVVAAVEEERFTQTKHDSSFPVNAIAFSLSKAGIEDINNIDEVCWYERPEDKEKRVLKMFNRHWFKTFFLRRKFKKEFKLNDPKYLLAHHFNYEGKIKYLPHHVSHAAFSYYTSKYKDAGILTVDGVGEEQTITISKGTGKNITLLKEINFPNSLGMYYSAMTSFLGFKPNEGEYKVMGLAAWGDHTKFLHKLGQVFIDVPGGFKIDLKFFPWEYTDQIMFNKRLSRILQLPNRLPEDELTQEHKDLAATVQFLYQVYFLKLVKITKELTQSENLCLSGGCAYNGVANGKAYTYFKSIHVPFAPSDAGSAIGACLYSNNKVRKNNTSPFLGPSYDNERIEQAIRYHTNDIKVYKLREDKLLKRVAEIIHSGRIVSWFQGAMEFGARALGNRSILATPLDGNMTKKLNAIIKKREGFRPFAPSIIEEEAGTYFDMKEPSPYMSLVVPVITKELKAITHVNNSARVQTVNKNFNPRYYKLLKQMKAVSGHPVVLNTSFNLKDQVITMEPERALQRFLSSEMDALVIDNFLILKK